MKGDFTRTSFDPAKGFTGVLKQQGRVDLDADWNEQVAIQQHLDRTRLTDIIGLSGVPNEEGGFGVTVTDNGADLLLSGGRLYVAGMLVEAQPGATYEEQPFLTAPPPLLPEDGRTDLIYLEAWEHHVTALEDPELREVALGGPDTTTRIRNVWQVRALPGVGDITCEDEIEGWPRPTVGAGLLTTETEETESATDPCTINPAGGFRGLENQLYRVEIHDGGDLGTATFKWSRENGSLAFSVTEFVDGLPTDRLRVGSLGPDRILALRVGDWIEVLDDATELSGEPGALVEIVDLDEAQRLITLSAPVSELDAAGHPRVRRWDQGRAAIATAAGPITLEDGIQIRFGGDGFRSGDYWSFAARTVTGDIERLTDALPQGIQRYSAALALITWRTPDGGETWNADVQDCRERFPSLTNICAEDVCFDNETCDLQGATTVQEALDILCRQRDLRHHNKHLHGWGIVCGLQVHCGPNGGERERRNVTVRDGYALDCEGNDVLLEQDQIIDVMEMVRQFPGEPLLDENGNGDVCLTLNAAEPRFTISAYTPERNRAREMLAGTLLMDYYNNCIRRLQEFFEDEFTIPEGEEERPAGPVHERVAAFTNLIAQPVNPTTGQHIFVSPREHEIMLDFYTRLRALLQSRTFCAMFDNARPFPDYPDQLREAGMDTAFGRSFHTRLRMRPQSAEAYTVGAGLNPLRPSVTINRFDLERKRLVSQIDPLAGIEAAELENDSGVGSVQDVAFSPDGREIYVIISTRDEQDTFFRAGRFARDSIQWDPLVMICGVKLVTLGLTAADAGALYAVGMRKVTIQENNQQRVEFRGTGLYRFTPRDVNPDMEPIVAFNASGHLCLTDDGRAFATAGAPEQRALPYDRVMALRVPSGQTLWERDGELGGSGTDDIAIVTRESNRQEMLYAVVGAQTGRGRRLVGLALASGTPVEMDVPLANSAYGLEPFPATNSLLLVSAEGYNLQMVDMRSNTMVDEYLLPMQVAPASIAVDRRREMVAVLNSGSNTITTVESRATLESGFRYPLRLLADYRSNVLNAFTDLLGGLLQYLKDCLCDHFLVDCPECEGDEQLYLGCVSIRGGQVERVCNFSRRHYVKSFPTMGYWLSLVPIIPMFSAAIEQFCCAVLPGLFSRVTTQPTNDRYTASYQPRVSTGSLFAGADILRNFDILGRFRDTTSRAGQARTVAADRIRATRATPPVIRTTGRALVNQPAERAASDLEARGVTVKREAYDPSRVGRLTTLFRTPPAGSEVTLFEENGKVRYYSISQPPSPAVGAPTDARLAELADAVAARERELAALREEQNAALRVATTQLDELRVTLGQTQERLVQRDSEIASLRSQVQTVLEGGAGGATPSPAREEIESLRRELAEMSRFRDEVNRFMRDRRE